LEEVRPRVPGVSFVDDLSRERSYSCAKEEVSEMRKLVIVCAAALLVAAGAMAAGKAEETPQGARAPVTIKAIWGVQHPAYSLQPDNVFESTLLEKFNIKIDWMGQVPHAEARDKFTLMFASNDYPDTIFNSNQPALFQKLGMEGYLQEVTQFFPKVPAYRKLFTDADWEYTVKNLRASDGKMYYMPQYRPYKATTYGWLYRKDTFSQMGLAFPRTPDQLFDVLSSIKKANPDSMPIPNKWGSGWLYAGFDEMFVVQGGMYVDPFTDQIVDFGALQPANRQKLAFIAKMYKSGLVDKEYATATDTQFDDRFRQNKAYMLRGFVGWYVRFTGLNRESNQKAEWTYSDQLMTAVPGKYAYTPIVPGQAWGPTFSDKLTGDRLNRFLEFVNWLCTDDGILFQNFGVQGKTYNMVNGKPVYVDTISFADATKRRPESFGMASYTIWSRDAIEQFYGTNAIFAFGDAVAARADHKPQQGWPLLLSAEERSKMADLGTVVNDIVAKYSDKFAMGELDALNDAHWGQFEADLKKANLEGFTKMNRDAFKKTYGR
jgi:putative aldouronate transport system substrate-binding protein